MTRHNIVLPAVAALSVTAVLASGCSAGSRVAAEDAAKVACDIKTDKPITANVLAYNSTAIDPYTNTMVQSCTKGDVTLKHRPIDFAGQVQKTTATLAEDNGTYDIIETYGFALPDLAAQQKLMPLDGLIEKYSDEYALDEINADMTSGMAYEGKTYALPMQAQTYVMAYRKDIFDKLGLKPPTTFDELRAVAKKIQDSGEVKYPVALPWLASSDIATAYDSVMGSLGENLTDPKAKTANLDSPTSIKALEEMRSLLPYMDPEVTTFDQPAVQQQMYNGSAAVSIMFSGRMNDLTMSSNSQYAEKTAFAPPPAAEKGGTLFNTLSVDGWSIPANTKVDEEALFQMMAASVSPKASRAAVPASYPAREGMVDSDSSPFADASNEAIKNVPPSEPYPWTSRISIAVTPTIAKIILGEISVEDGAAKMQSTATKILADYR